MKVSDAALKELRLQVENLLKPQEVKRIRTKIGLTQREAGAILGGGPNAFQKYEQDTVTVSKPMSNLLRVLALQLPFMKISESMGNHDSKIVDAGSVG
jgi:HTH-type transcriptional regulator/antitoxin MqsA